MDISMVEFLLSVTVLGIIVIIDQLRDIRQVVYDIRKDMPWGK